MTLLGVLTLAASHLTAGVTTPSREGGVIRRKEFYRHVYFAARTVGYLIPSCSR